MERKIIITADGSTTIHIPEWNEQYHSVHGAIQEAEHVYIKNGLLHLFTNSKSANYSILEIGFGTGLNCLLSVQNAKIHKKPLNYVGVDAFPIMDEEIEKLNYPKLIDGTSDLFSQMHSSSWEETHPLKPNFSLFKTKQLFEELILDQQFDLIYFDAFGARVQAELWTVEIILRMYDFLTFGGCLVTYSAKGSVRRALKEVGFIVEKLAGPPGKREMLRACKPKTKE